jgi:magnesium chelatase accessory protein
MRLRWRCSPVAADFLRSEIEVQGIRISVLERVCGGEASKPSIVLLHGLVAEAATFKQLMRELPSDRRVVAIDAPGSGYSDHPNDASFAALAAIVGQTLRVLGLQGAVLLGHSHGGAIALQLASSEPELLRGMVLLCPAHPFSGKEDGLVRFYLSLPGHMFAHCLPLVPRPLLLFAFRHMPGRRSSFGYEELEPYVHTLRRTGTVKHMLGLLRTWRADMRALRHKMQLRSVHTPALLLWGDRDIVVPLSSAERLMRHLANPRLVPLQGVGHVPNEEAPKETAVAIALWLREQGL